MVQCQMERMTGDAILAGLIPELNVSIIYAHRKQVYMKNNKKLIIIIISIVVAIFIFTILAITLMSGLTAYFVSKNVGMAAGVQDGIADDIIKQVSPIYFPITPDFNATTADVDVTRYVKVSIVLTYTENAKELAVELPEKVYMIKDKIYAIIRSYTLEQLRTNEGIEKLKIEIKNEINGMLKNGKIDDVLLVDLTLS